MITTPANAQLGALIQRLNGFGEEVKQIIDVANWNWATATTEAMKANHGENAHDVQRYINRTWTLTESIGFEIEPPELQGLSIYHGVRVFASAPYAADLEQGVPGQNRAYPFYWQEIYAGGPREALEQEINASLNDLLASLAERA